MRASAAIFFFFFGGGGGGGLEGLVVGTHPLTLRLKGLGFRVEASHGGVLLIRIRVLGLGF